LTNIGIVARHAFRVAIGATKQFGSLQCCCLMGLFGASLSACARSASGRRRHTAIRGAALRRRAGADLGRSVPLRSL